MTASAPPTALRAPMSNEGWTYHRGTGGGLPRALLRPDTPWPSPTRRAKASATRTPSAWECVQAIRTTLGLSMTELAKELGVSRQAIYKWEQGSKPDIAVDGALNRLHKVATAFCDAGISDAKQLVRRPQFAGESLLELWRKQKENGTSVQALVKEERRMQSEYESFKRGSSKAVNKDAWRSYLSIPSTDEER